MSNVARHWYVFGLDVQSDPNTPIFAQVPGNNEVPAQAAPARRNQVRLGDDVERPRVNHDGGYGFKIAGQTVRTMCYAFTTRAAAAGYAKEQAEKTPKIMYGIYECVQVFETTTPTIIEKKFNDAGELIPVV